MVLRLTLLDNVSGLRWKHSNDAELRILNVEPFMILDNMQVVLPPAPAELFVVHRQRIEADKILTWMGQYRAVPNSANNRKADYCGAGFWLLNSTIRGSDATRILRELTAALTQAIQSAASARQPWDVTRAPVDSIARNIREPPLGSFDAYRDLGRESICIDASGGHDVDGVLDALQENRDGRFDRFNRVIISRDTTVLNAIENRARIPVKRLSDVLPQPPSPAPSKPGGQTVRAPSPDGSSEMARLSRELRQANVRADGLAKALGELEANLSRSPKWSWSAAAAGAAASGALILLGIEALRFFFGGPPYDAAPKLQAQISRLRSDVDKVQVQLKRQREVLGPNQDETPNATVAQNPPSGDSPDPNSPNARLDSAPLPTVAPRLVPTVSTQDLKTIVGERILTRGGAYAPYVLVDVDSPGRERAIPGAVLCLPKAAKSVRCTEKDLRQFYRQGENLIFYGHDNAPRSPAADLASDLAGAPNVYWYRDGYEGWRKAQGEAAQ